MIALSREARLDRADLLRQAEASGGEEVNGIVGVEVVEGPGGPHLLVEFVFAPDDILAREITITAAAPSTPQPIYRMNSGSSTTATNPAELVTSIDRNASPSARKIAPAIIPAAIIGKEGSEICRKDAATSSTSPSAPDRRSNG